MIDAEQLTSITNYLGAAVMLLIVAYHFVDARASAGGKAKAD